MTAVSVMPSSKSLQMISQNTFQNLNNMQNISLLIFSFEIWLGKNNIKATQTKLFSKQISNNANKFLCLANKFQTIVFQLLEVIQLHDRLSATVC